MNGIYSLVLLLAISTSALAGQTPKFEALWNRYSQQANSVPLQDGCKPRWIKANPNVPFRGTIILHHGFTVCPQMYFEWGENYLSPNGYDVLLTVLPGHGRVWEGDNNSLNDISALPTRENWYEIYSPTIKAFNELMHESRGTRILGGFSVGGALAMAEMMDEPHLFDRVILFSPFFRLSEAKKSDFGSDQKWLEILQNLAGPLVEQKAYILDLISNPRYPMYPISTYRQTWGDGCEITERAAGRAGYCQFSLNAISADQQLALWGLNQIPANQYLPPIQIAAAEQDNTASTVYMRGFVAAVESATHTSPGLCFFRKGANHSLLSRYDDPTEDKFWLPVLLEQATRFVLTGQKFDTNGMVASEDNFPYCGTQH